MAIGCVRESAQGACVVSGSANTSSATSTAPAKLVLLFTVANQNQTNWCWSAVATSVSHYYDPHSIWTQCSTANAVLGRPDCCVAANASDKAKCNQQARLDIALVKTHNLVQLIDQRNSPLTFDDIKNEIDNSRVVGTRVRWNGGGGGHFQAIHGYEITPSGSEYIYISDPIYGNTQIKYSRFASYYTGTGGTWTHSYLTDRMLMVTLAGGQIDLDGQDVVDDADLMGA
ncbi:papain-like cysteine protease family protein [Methylobacterium terricola]